MRNVPGLRQEELIIPDIESYHPRNLFLQIFDGQITNSCLLTYAYFIRNAKNANDSNADQLLHKEPEQF